MLYALLFQHKPISSHNIKGYLQSFYIMWWIMLIPAIRKKGKRVIILRAVNVYCNLIIALINGHLQQEVINLLAASVC